MHLIGSAIIATQIVNGDDGRQMTDDKDPHAMSSTEKVKQSENIQNSTFCEVYWEENSGEISKISYSDLRENYRAPCQRKRRKSLKS